jgi:trimeric autotransporter adhesin
LPLRFRVIVAFAGGVLTAAAQTWTLNPVIGPVSRGDGSPAPQALLNAPVGMLADAAGNVYIAESNAGVIRMVRASDGNIVTIAGTGAQNDGVEGGPAVSTDLMNPTLLLFDNAGTLYFADSGACRIRKILSDGTIRNVAGTGHCVGSSNRFTNGPGREAPALETDLGHVSGMTFDPAGRMVFSENDINLVRRTDSDGIIRILTGNGKASYSGDGGLANAATVNAPAGVAFDPAGNLYIADGANCRVRLIDPDSNISTVAGNGSCSGRSPKYPGGQALRTSMGVLGGMVYDPANNSLIIASPGMARVVQYDLTAQTISSILGNGSIGIPDFTQQNPQQFVANETNGVALAPGGGGGYLVSATSSFQVYLLANNTVTSFAGRWPADADILRPASTCTRPDGTLIVIDAGTERLLSVDPVAGTIARFAGADSPIGYTSGDKGLAIRAQITNPKRVYCAASGDVYLSQSTNIRKIDTNGIITSARTGLGNPVGMLMDPTGLLIYSDTVYNRVYSYNFSNAKTNFVAGNGIAGYSGDGGPVLSAQLNTPTDLVLDASGNLFIADLGNRVVREFRISDGTMQTYVGSTDDFTYADITGRTATGIGIGSVTSLAVDGAGNLYVAEANRLSQVTPGGTVNVLLGYIGENDSGQQYYRVAPLYGAGGLTFGADGSLYFTMNQTGALFSLLAVGSQ